MTSRAGRVIEALIADATAADIFRRLESIPDESLSRRLIVDAVAMGKVPVARVAVVMVAMQHLGLGDQGDRLLGLVADRSQPLDRRAVALQILGRFDREVVGAAMRKLDPDDAAALTAEPVVQMAARAADDPDEAAHYGELLARMKGELQLHIARRVEVQRQRQMVSAVKLYADALATPGTEPVHHVMIEALVSERSALAIELLDVLRDQAEDPEVRRAFQRAGMVARTTNIDKP